METTTHRPGTRALTYGLPLAVLGLIAWLALAAAGGTDNPLGLLAPLAVIVGVVLLVVGAVARIRS